MGEGRELHLTWGSRAARFACPPDQSWPAAMTCLTMRVPSGMDAAWERVRAWFPDTWAQDAERRAWWASAGSASAIWGACNSTRDALLQVCTAEGVSVQDVTADQPPHGPLCLEHGLPCVRRVDALTGRGFAECSHHDAARGDCTVVYDDGLSSAEHARGCRTPA